MRTMRSSKRVVDKQISNARQNGFKACHILWFRLNLLLVLVLAFAFLFHIETTVFQHDNGTFFLLCQHLSLEVIAKPILDKHNLLIQQLLELSHYRRQRHLVFLLTFWSTDMRGDNEPIWLHCQQFLNRRDSRSDTRSVRDFEVGIQRHIEICAHKNAFSFGRHRTFVIHADTKTIALRFHQIQCDLGRQIECLGLLFFRHCALSTREL
mmetsp:Transcript_48683/g.80756  ORF Transcript_48683/g.80756 Transcript_48683/m.80756 type:complete len:209 (+) Transcript_48683:1013-1639(+)